MYSRVNDWDDYDGSEEEDWQDACPLDYKRKRKDINEEETDSEF